MIWFILALPLLALGVWGALMLAWRLLPIVVGLAVFALSGHNLPFALVSVLLVYLIQRQRARSAAPAAQPVFVRQERRRGHLLEAGGLGGRPWAARPQREKVPAAPRPAPRVELTVPEAPAPDTFSADTLSGAVDTLLRRDGARLPAEARASLIRVRERVAEAAALFGDGPDDGLGGGPGDTGSGGLKGPVSEGALLTRQIALTYLPDTVAAYLRLPRSQADTAALLDGRTGRQLLNEQLAMLEAALGDVLVRAVQGEGERLLHQQRFLEARLKPRRGDFEV